MKDLFEQKKIDLNNDNLDNGLRIKDLLTLISDNNYREVIIKEFELENEMETIIEVGNVGTVFDKIKYYIKHYMRYNISASTKDISVYSEERKIDGEPNDVVVFNFEKYLSDNQEYENLESMAIYNAKNKYFDQYNMSKYANSLLKLRKPELNSLVKYNINVFKDLAQVDEDFNKNRFYRLVKYKGNNFLRGFTTSKYNNYGVDFTFVIGVLVLYKNMCNIGGLSYDITYCALNESKIELIATENQVIQGGEFGSLSTAIKIATNDLGDEALSFSNIINIQNASGKFHLFPRKSSIENGSLKIIHTTGINKVMEALKNMDDVLNTSQKFLEELKDINTIKNPDELRMKIKMKIEHPRSPLRKITELSDIFKRKIDNKISDFARLLEMCGKAEELDMKFDLKDKLRYIISDIILYGNTK